MGSSLNEGPLFRTQYGTAALKEGRLKGHLFRELPICDRTLPAPGLKHRDANFATALTLNETTDGMVGEARTC